MKKFIGEKNNCWIQQDLSDKAAYEIYRFLSNLAWDFQNRYHDQIDCHEQAISFLEENALFQPEINKNDEESPF